MNQSSAGLSLMELLIASSIGILVIIVLGQVDVSRLVIVNKVHDNSESYQEGIFALQHMLKAIEGADRVAFPAPAPAQGPSPTIQFRMPPADPLEISDPTKYVWKQYTIGGRRLALFENGTSCAPRRVVASNLDGVTFQLVDVAPAPPASGGVGGEPLPGRSEDINTVEVRVTVPEPATGNPEVLRGTVTIRGTGYTGGTTAASVRGLLRATDAPPPAAPCVP